MLRKIVAVLATATMLIVGFSAMPASATVTSNPGAVKKNGWNLGYSSPAGVLPSTSVTTTLVPGTTDVSSYLSIQFGNTLVQSLAGHDIVVTWNETFPAGVTWNTGQYDPKKPYKYIRGEGGGGYQPAYSDVNARNENPDVSGPPNSSVFTVPTSVSEITQSWQYFGVILGFSMTSDMLTAGDYTIAPSLYDRTAGAPITISAAEGENNAFTTSSWYSTSGEGAFAGSIPAKTRLTQQVMTCVPASSLVEGHVLATDRLVDGSSVGMSPYGTSFYIKGTQSYGGQFSPTWTVPSTVASANWAGIRINSQIEIDNSDNASSQPAPSFDLIVTDTTADNAQVEASCAPPAPAKPSFTLTSRNAATISWAKVAGDTNVNYWDRTVTYNWAVFRASDLTTPVMSYSVENPTLTNGIYTESVYFRDSNWEPIDLDLDTNYVLRMTAIGNGDYVESEYSEPSNPSMLAAPTAPTGVALDIVSQTSFKVTWNKLASDVERTGCGSPNCGRTVEYTYQLFKASNLNTVVAQGGMMNATLTGNSYTATLSNVMSGPPMWMTVRLQASTDYVVKVKAYDMTSSLESAYSAASATDSLMGPPAPNTPTDPVATVSMVSAKLTVRAGETGNRHALVVYAQSDTTFSNPLTTSNNSYSSCNATSPGALTYNCTVSINTGAATFTAPNMYVVRAMSTNIDGLESAQSAASTTFIGGIPGVIIAAPSNGNTAGDAKTITSTFPAITDNYGSTTGMYVQPKGSFITDYKGNFYTFVEVGADGVIGKKFEIKKLKSDFTGTDASFGTGGKVTTTVNYGTNGASVYFPNIWTFANSTKMVMLSNAPNFDEFNQNMGTDTFLREGTIGQGFGTPIDMAGKATEFCGTNVDPSLVEGVYGYFNPFFGLAALNRPAVSVSCVSTDPVSYVNRTEQFVATVGVDGTLTEVFKLNSYNSTQNTVYRSSTSYNPAASTSSDVAAVIYVVRAKNTNGTYSNWERVLVRVMVDGSTTETPVSLTPVGSSEPSVSLAPVNDGSTVYATINESGVTKLMTVPVASGSFSAATPIVIPDVPMMTSVSLSFPTSGAPVVNGKIAFIRNDFAMGGRSISPLSYNIATGAVVTGEILSYSTSGTPVNFSAIDAAGNLNFIYTPAVAQANLVHSVIQWKNIRDMVAVPTPAVTIPKSTFSLNAGGTSITIEGINLSETSAAKKVTGVRFGTGTGTTGLVTSITKTATSITVKIPTSTIAGATTAPTAATAFTAPISIVLGSGSSLVAGSVTYIGTAKLAQSVTLTVSTALANTAEADRVISTQLGAVVPTLAAVPGAEVLSTSNAAICAIVDGKVRFLSNGNCVVKATKAGNDWLAEGSATATIPVLKADSVTAGFAEGEVPSEVLEEDEAIAPVIRLASGRTDYTMTSADTAKCSINADTKMIWFKQGNQNCVITIATATSNATWAAVTYTWTIAIQPPAGGAGSPLLVRNDNVMVKLPGLALKWNQKTNQVYFVTRVKWIGPVQAKMTFTDLDGALQSCVVNFGTLKKTPLPKNGDPFILTSPALCTDTKSVLNKTNTSAEKAAQTLAYNKFKALVAANTLAGESTSVEFTYRRELHRATDYALRNPGETLLTKEWSTPTYARLYYKAIDTITAALPKGVVASATTSPDGAFNPVITLESKRTDYTVTSADESKCSVLADGRIWAKAAGETCSLSIGTGANNVWAGKTYTWTFPILAGVAVDSASAIIAPSNKTTANAGPISIIWDQAKYAVAMTLTNRNVGLVTAKMTFTGLDLQQYTCEVKFGSSSKVKSTLALAYKTQSSAAFCSYTTGLTSAQKATQTAALAKFKALVAARKSGLGVGVIPVTFAFKFQAHNPLTGVLLPGETLNTDAAKPWSPNIHVKLNYRAAAY